MQQDSLVESKEEVVVGHADLAGSAVWHLAVVAANDVV
jgi:hypothetical protein